MNGVAAAYRLHTSIAFSNTDVAAAVASWDIRIGGSGHGRCSRRCQLGYSNRKEEADTDVTAAVASWDIRIGGADTDVPAAVASWDIRLGESGPGQLHARASYAVR